MGLKLVGGRAKGQKLKGPKKAGIRPAAARVRKSLFDILGDLKGLKILDLFAGTGSMGLEALSRGAAEVTFVDDDEAAIKLLFHNLKQVGYLPQAHVLKAKAHQALRRLDRKGLQYDLIFVDPPYDQGQVADSLKILDDRTLLADGGQILCEHSPREKPPFLSRLQCVDTRKYGQTFVSFFKRP
jgi:16S rRNA (guanine(966)-N(2))-methyltransferase RsmD